MSNVYIIQNNGNSIPLKRIRCQDEERELQSLLENNNGLLVGDQINPEDPRRWLLLKREMPVPSPSTGSDRWSIDFFFVDQDAVPTFVECKRYYDTRSRREIVGQMLEYAANGQHYWTVDSLREITEESARKNNQEVDDLLYELTGDETMISDDFFQNILENLKEGQIRLIFFLEESPYELRSIVDYLNKQMERSEVLLVEAKQYTDGKVKLVVPQLFGYTEQARMIKKTVTVQKSQSEKRRKWNEETYFVDARENHKLNDNEIAALKKLYDYARNKADNIGWGTGLNRGSFSPKFSHISVKSLFTVFANGELRFNFHWLVNEHERKYADFLKKKINSIPDITLNPNSEFPSFQIGEWKNKVDAIIHVFDEVVNE